MSNIGFYYFMILLENVSINQFVLFSWLKMHAVFIAKTFLQAFKVFIEKDVLKNSHCIIEIIIFLILT